MIAASALAAASLAAFGGAAPAPPTLSVSPAHLELEAGGAARVHVQSAAGRPLVFVARSAGLVLDGRGRPRLVGARDAASWLVVVPRAASASSGSTFLVRARCPASARPGDHGAILLVTATTPDRRSSNVVMRIGLIVTVRVPGATIRRLDVIAVRTTPLPRGRGRVIAITVANRGNLIESIGGRRLEVALIRRGRVVSHLRVARRSLLPRTRATVSFRWRAPTLGLVLARVTLAQPNGGTKTKTFPLRL